MSGNYLLHLNLQRTIGYNFSLEIILRVEHYWSIFTAPKYIRHKKITYVIIKPLTNTNSLLIRSTLQKLKRRFHCHNYCTLSRDFWKYSPSSTQTLHNLSYLRMSVNTLKKLMSNNYRSEGIWVFPKPNRGHWINLNTDQWQHPHYNIIITTPKCELYVIIQYYSYKT